MKQPVSWMVVAVLGGLGLGIWFFLRADPFGDAMHEREIATRRLAEYLVKSRAGQRVLIISNPFAPTQGGRILAQEAAGIRGLRKGFADKIAIEAVAYPNLRPEARTNPRSIETLPGTSTPLSFLMADDCFDQLVTQYPACDLIVSLVGLPANLDQVAVWKRPAPPRFALLLPDLRVIGDAPAVKDALKSGKLAGFIAQKPIRSTSTVAHESAFDRQFLLINNENVEQMLADYPALIGPME